MGEGLLGLSRAILQTGVPSSVLSLWPVDDKATLKLMAEMYAGYSPQRHSATLKPLTSGHRPCY